MYFSFFEFFTLTHTLQKAPLLNVCHSHRRICLCRGSLSPTSKDLRPSHVQLGNRLDRSRSGSAPELVNRGQARCGALVLAWSGQSALAVRKIVVLGGGKNHCCKVGEVSFEFILNDCRHLEKVQK